MVLNDNTLTALKFKYFIKTSLLVLVLHFPSYTDLQSALSLKRVYYKNTRHALCEGNRSAPSSEVPVKLPLHKAMN